MKLKKIMAEGLDPETIQVWDDKKIVCTVRSDGSMKINTTVVPGEMEEIMLVSKNFWLFYDNLSYK
jgi:hypothetical protein